MAYQSNGGEDPRAERSRAALISSITELGETVGDPLSVTAVTRAASVHRATFYNHFDSVEHLAAEAIAEHLGRLQAADYRDRHDGVAPAVVGTRTLHEILTFLQGHPGLYRLASAWVAPSGLSGVGEIIRRQVRAFRFEFGNPAEANSAVEDTYIAGGMAAVFATILSAEITAESAPARLLALLPAWMQHPLRP